MAAPFLVVLVRLVCLLVLVNLAIIRAMRHCEDGQYHEQRSASCRPCTRCPDNKIVLAFCQDQNDTLCGPFREFMFDNFDRDQQKHHKPSVPPPPGENEVYLAPPNEEAYWRNLAFAVIGVLSGLILITVMVVVGTWQHFKRSARRKATYNCDSDTDTDNPYVVVRTIRSLPDSSNSSSIPQAPENLHHLMRQRQRLLRAYHPKRRLLNEYVDDVFESEDSAGSRTGPRMPLQTIPEGDQSESESRNGSRSSRSPHGESPGSQNSPQTHVMVSLLHIDENLL